MGPIVQKEAHNLLLAQRESSVEVKHLQNHQEIALQDSFAKMVPKQTDPQMEKLEMNVQQAHIVHLEVCLPHLALQEHIQMLLEMSVRKTVSTAQVGSSVQGLATLSQQVNVIQATSVHLGRRCAIPMVSSALLAISVLWALKILSDVKVVLIKIL